MQRGFFLTRFLILAFLSFSCSKSDFNGKKVERPAVDHTITAMGIEENTNGGSKSVTTNDRVHFVIQAGDWRVLSRDDRKNIQPVDLYFVLDITASMDSAINAMKTGIRELTQRLVSQGIDLQVGLVRFVDARSWVDTKSLPLSKDLTTFEQTLAATSTVGNGDYPESSMYAATRAVEFLRTQSRSNSLKALLLISDVVGHNGADADSPPATGSVPDLDRDCSIAPFVNAIKQYSDILATTSRRGDFKFFYTVPNPSISSDPGASFRCRVSPGSSQRFNADEQARAIMAAIPHENAGGALINPTTGKIAWPLTNSNFVETIAPMLQNNVVSSEIRGLCLAASADLYLAQQKVKSWSPRELRLLNEEIRRGNNSINIGEGFKPTAPGNYNLTMRVQRCCVQQSDLDAGRTNCTKSYEQVISYQVTAQ